MPKMSEIIQALIDNPDDLSQLPTMLEQAVEYENSEVEYQTRIDKLQSTNRNLLKMIPQPEELKQREDPAVEKVNDMPTLTDGVEAMKKLLGGNE